MPVLKLSLLISAPASRCFDLSRSVDLHQISTTHTGEVAIAGIITGLMGPGDTVTWRARHLGFRQNLTSTITAYQRPCFFVDEQVAGAFKAFRHEHRFREQEGKTLMTDIFDYESPFGLLGKLADKLFLERYMFRLLHERNRVIKEYAETAKWRQVLAE